MLTQNNLDLLMQNIQAGKKAYIYYVASLVETREGYIEELKYKSVPEYKVVKLNLTNIENAYIELRNYKNHPEQYHIEEEECYYDIYTRYVHYYVVKNSEGPYEKDFNPRYPSNIYGYKKYLYNKGTLVQDYIDPSPIKEIYTNAIQYYGKSTIEAKNLYDAGKLDWKYIYLPNGIISDGIEYSYLTSDYYVLDIENFPKVEKPLINVKQKTPYFMTNEDAQSAIKEFNA